jgi:hypothetical protein
MKSEQIIETARQNLGHFEKSARGTYYELRGIFTSEALLIASVIKSLEVNLLIESGRARGYSTKIFAEFFKNYPSFRIISIDFDRNSEDSKHSEEQLKKYGNLKLVYGDSTEILPTLITEKCAVFIDGPKGDEALLLAAKVMENSLVQAVFIHDLHQNTFIRNVCDIIFNKTFFSDNKDYVTEFSFLDKDCWSKLASHGEAPYIRKGKNINSYASTVAVIFNEENAINKLALENYQSYYAHLNPHSFKNLVRMFLSHFPKLSGPIFRIYEFLKR